MNVVEAHTRYLKSGKFFEPEYGRDHEVLFLFCESNPILSSEHTRELIDILAGGERQSKYFVADLLYYYQSAPAELLAPVLRAAIELGDPSFNRIFLRVSLVIYGEQAVVNSLVESFKAGGVIDRIGVSLLTYWLQGYHVDFAALCELIEQTVESTDNLVELYHYKLSLPLLPHWKDQFPDIPDDALSLQQQISGNKEYEHLLYEQLGWETLLQ